MSAVTDSSPNRKRDQERCLYVSAEQKDWVAKTGDSLASATSSHVAHGAGASLSDSTAEPSGMFAGRS